MAKKMFLFIFVALICRKLFFQNGTGGHFGFTPREKNATIFVRDTGAKYFLKGLRKSNQSSKHLSQKVVMKVRFFTLLLSFIEGSFEYVSDIIWTVLAREQVCFKITLGSSPNVAGKTGGIVRIK